MSGPDAASEDRTSVAAPTPDLLLRIDTRGVSDVEVAAVTAALLAVATPVGEPVQVAVPAWRRASLREATGGARIAKPWQLEA